MRKRNKPILLATLLVVFVGAAVAMNVMMQPKSANEPPAPVPQAEDPALGAARKEDNSPSAKAAAAALAAPVKGGGPRGAPGGLSGPGGPGTKMSIVKPKGSSFKPKPNDSMTSGQWYTDEFGYKGSKPKTGG